MKFTNVTEEEFIIVSAQVKLYADSVEHQSCGVDSYSVEDCARETMSMVGVQESHSSDLGSISDDTYRASIVVAETIRWLIDIQEGKELSEVVAEMKEAFYP